MTRTRISQLKTHPNPSELIGKEIELKGWCRTVRLQKNFMFIEINDGSTLTNFQVIIEPEIQNYKTLVEELSTGASVHIQGSIVESPGKGQEIELHAQQVRIVGTCNPEKYPLQKKRHSFEFLRSIAHLRPRTNTLGAVARVRNALAFATHLFFQKENFLYIQTPLITASDCEGAGEMFRVSTLNPEKIPLTPEKTVDYTQDFFGKPAYLTVSGQLNAEIFACALSDVYTFGPTFRAENSRTSRHLAEFWMIEPEMAFADLNDDMNNAEKYLKFVIHYVLENCGEDLAFFDQFIEKGLIQKLKKVIETPFERVSYTYAIRVLEKSGKKFEYPVKWGNDLQSEHERYLSEEFFAKPTIITDYPINIKPFYMRKNDDEKTVANMDILVQGIGEIVGGSQREERLDQLKARMDALHLSKEEYWWYLELREYGSVPHAGYGVGFERLLQFITGIENIRDAIAFPRAPGTAEF